MAAYSRILILILLMMYFLTASSTSSSHPPSDTFLHHLHRRCPLQIPSSLPIEIDGESLERVLLSTSKDVHTAVLFYDSKSPFSSTIRCRFDMLSSMFPQIDHIAVERSLAMPSLLSRYGIHSLPALFIVNKTAKIRYYGPKQLYALVHFYKRTTGLEPIGNDAHSDAYDIMNDQIVLWSSWREMIVKEPYLVLAIVFLLLRAFLYFCPEILSHVTALWMWSKRQFNFGIFVEWNQLLGRVLHLIDVKRAWSKLKLCKTRNFQNGARSARVWASSLASVSLGESSSARATSSE